MGSTIKDIVQIPALKFTISTNIYKKKNINTPSMCALAIILCMIFKTYTILGSFFFNLHFQSASLQIL